MEEINHKALQAPYEPALAIIAYKQNKDDIQGYYLESHDISPEGKMLEGKPMMAETIANLIEYLENKESVISMEQGFIEECVLYIDMKTRKLVWYRPAEKRSLYFSKSLNLPNGEAWIPPMIYQLVGTDLSMYTFKGKNRPTHDTELFKAPFHNISGASVCMGNAKIDGKKVDVSERVKDTEHKFWNSEFSHIWGTKVIKGNINSIWKELITTGRKFPTSKLLPTHINLEEIFE